MAALGFGTATTATPSRNGSAAALNGAKLIVSSGLSATALNVNVATRARLLPLPLNYARSIEAPRWSIRLVYHRSRELHQPTLEAESRSECCKCNRAFGPLSIQSILQGGKDNLLRIFHILREIDFCPRQSGDFLRSEYISLHHHPKHVVQRITPGAGAPCARVIDQDGQILHSDF